MDELENLIAVALGQQPADLAVRGAQVFNVFTGEFSKSDVLVAGGVVAAVLPFKEEMEYNALQLVKAEGKWLVPGFIDAHLHIESSMLAPLEYANLATLNGVTSVIADPHEICNVLGVSGIRYMLYSTEQACCRTFFMLPSCVPASSLVSSHTSLQAKDLDTFLAHPRILGLGELMNYPGLLACSSEVIEKIEMIRFYNQQTFAPLEGLVIDGHAPFLSGAQLQAYIAAGVHSDHECSTAEEAKERLAAGMGVMLRQGSGAKNLLDLVPAITPHNEHLCVLCTDDRHINDLVEEGSINFMVRKLVQDGRLNLPSILKMASYNVARLFSLAHIGAIAPGYMADFAIYPNLEDWKPEKVWLQGELVAENGKSLQMSSYLGNSDFLYNTVHLGKGISHEKLRIKDKQCEVRVIELVPGQIITQELHCRMPAKDNYLQADLANGIAKLAVFERHGDSGDDGAVGLGFVKGLGIKAGAIASTVAHDAHNLVVAGVNDADMLVAAKALEKAGGGLAVCLDGEILSLLELPLAGLFSASPWAEAYASQKKLIASLPKLGLQEGQDPFMLLSFLCLEVIPKLKLTAYGLVDAENFVLTSLYMD